MSRSRRRLQPNLPFTAAFALIQVLRDPGQPGEETGSRAPSVDRALTGGRPDSPFRAIPEPFDRPYASFGTDDLAAPVSKPLPENGPAFPSPDRGGEPG